MVAWSLLVMVKHLVHHQHWFLDTLIKEVSRLLWLCILDSNSCTVSLQESWYNYDDVNHSSYVVNTTRYDNSFSSNETYPDSSMSTLTTYTNYSSVLIESDINLYRTEPDVQHIDDTNGDNCIQSSILHYPDDEEC